MRARRRLTDKFAKFEQGLSQLQSFLIKNKDDWRYEVSTWDQGRDKAYKPAFLKELMDKYSWDADTIAETYAAIKNAPLKAELSSEKLATFLIQSGSNPWLLQFTSKAYTDPSLAGRFQDSSLSSELKKALASNDWNFIKKDICQNVINNPVIGKEVSHRYLLAEAFKSVTLKPRKDLEKAKEEAEQAQGAGLITIDDVTAAFQRLKDQLEAKEGRPLTTDEIIDMVIGEQEAQMNQLLQKDPNAVTVLEEEKTEETPLETEGAGTTDQDTEVPNNNPLVDVLDMSNQVQYPYKNMGPNPSDPSVTMLMPSRPDEYQVSMADPYRSPSPESLKQQWI